MNGRAKRDRSGPPWWVATGVVLGAVAALVILERCRPLRRQQEPPGRRDLRNLAVAALGAAALRIAEKPIVEPLAEAVERRGWGLLGRLDLPSPMEFVLALVLLDYTLYLWHILTHRVPFLWRFHLVHHIDLDLSTTTALRFHFAELVLSVPWRAAQVALIGVAPRALAAWQRGTLLSILFHHSNLRLPLALERRLVRVIATPRLHGIHHSAVAEETGSNWSSGLTVWDRLHGTFRLDVPQSSITIGLPAYRAVEDVALPALLAMPFTKERPSWRWPSRVGGERVAHRR